MNINNKLFVMGSVAADGSVVAGLDFTAEHAGTGVYNVTYAPPFGAQPILFLRPMADLALYRSTLSNETATGFTVTTVVIIGGLGIDQPFKFIAIDEF